mmetsp:Transcript_12423/g.8660  ORF Transcript_12423/g.8660 Transcript_12423/m.8660 type:complete len:121 (+) Transcript_12423:562-924(+)
MFGLDKDFLLSMNEKNCPRFGAEFEAAWGNVNAYSQVEFANSFPEINKSIVSAGGDLQDFCQYLEWAHLNGVELNIDEAQHLDLHHFCFSYTESRIKSKRGVDERDSSLVSSMFINDLKN